MPDSTEPIRRAIAAGLLVAQLTRWLRGLAVGPDLTLNLLSAEVTDLAPSLPERTHGATLPGQPCGQLPVPWPG
jgi:hypothetical protein